jgi:long-chain acyl-CoA synthetase
MIQLFSELLAYRAAAHPQRVALISSDVFYNYNELYQLALKAANWLKSKQLKKGDHIALLDFNNAAYVHLVNGCLIAGIIPVSINWRLTQNEMEYIVKDADCKLFVFGAAFQNNATAVMHTTAVPALEMLEVFEVIQSLQPIAPSALPTLSLHDQALLIYTSGTTGNPKGVLLSNENVFEMYYALRSETPLFGPASVNLIAGPWYAVVGIGYFVFGVFTGCTNVLVKIFDPLEVLRLIATYRVTNAFFAPIMMKIICAMEEVHEYDLSSLQNIQYGGSPIEENQLRICYNTFKCHFTQGYGLTETSGIATALRFDDHVRILSSEDNELKNLLRSAGKPYNGVEIKIVDESGAKLEFGAIGEVVIRGKVVAMGYKNANSDNHKIFNNDGWFFTGDMGYLNEQGYLFLVDRKNDMIISKGQNIYPADVEQYLVLHPQIKELAVIGVPHETYGEAVGVVAVLKEGALDVTSLRNWAKNILPEYKLPALLEIVNELPRNPTGKVLRKVLREKYWLNKTRRIN